jgi:hypothetical protein
MDRSHCSQGVSGAFTFVPQALGSQALGSQALGSQALGSRSFTNVHSPKLTGPTMLGHLTDVSRCNLSGFAPAKKSGFEPAPTGLAVVRDSAWK